MAIVVGLVTLLPFVDNAPTASAARAWYVAPWGNDGASGGWSSPLRTINRAVSNAGAGDTVVLRGGVYHEMVQVYGKQVHLRSQPGERAVLDGAVVVDGWRSDGGDWVSDGWTTQFYREKPGGPVSSSNKVAGYPDQMFFNGAPLQQVFGRNNVVPGTFWHDTKNDRLWIGDDPTGARVEASKLRWGIYLNNAHGSTLTDITVRRFATEKRHMAAIRMYSNNVVASGVVAELNARIGLSASGTNIVVRDGRFTDNGYLGVHANQATTFIVERSAIKGNNKAGFDDFHSAGGLKVTTSEGITVRDSDVSYNDGPGIWLDIDTRYATLSRNLTEGNGRAGIEIEISRNVNVLSNVTLNNGEAGIWVLESQDVVVMHNASFFNANGIEVEEGPRRDVRNVRVDNNTIGRAKSGSRALLDVNDWTEQRSAAEMGVTADYNAFWVPPGSGTDILARWARWPTQPAYPTDLPSLHSTTSQGYNSVMSTADANPYVRDAAAGDYRGLDSLRRGAPLRGSAAAELGVADGTRRRIGPVGPVIRR